MMLIVSIPVIIIIMIIMIMIIIITMAVVSKLFVWVKFKKFKMKPPLLLRIGD